MPYMGPPSLMMCLLSDFQDISSYSAYVMLPKAVVILQLPRYSYVFAVIPLLLLYCSVDR